MDTLGSDGMFSAREVADNLQHVSKSPEVVYQH